MSVSDHINEIDRVLGGEPTGRDSFVMQSWKRCIDQHDLDPARPSPAHIGTAARFKEHREQSERLCHIKDRYRLLLVR